MKAGVFLFFFQNYQLHTITNKIEERVMKTSVTIFFIIAVICNLAFSQVSTTGSTTATESLPSFDKATAAYAVPNKLSYQGMLTTSVGTPVIDGSYNLQFDIYNLPVGGILKYTETQTGIPVSKGTFSVVLRPTSTIFAESLFVEVTALAGPSISTPITFSPRSELTSAPYSLGPWITNGSDIYFPGDHVSIGTSTYPFWSSYLTVQKPDAFITAKADPGWAGVVIDKTASFDNNYVILQTGGSDRWVLGTVGNDDFKIYNWLGNRTALYANYSNGWVGINTSTPTTTLDVNGNVRVNGDITYATPKTGYISGSALAAGKSLYSDDSFTYSSGVYNNGTTTAYYMIPLDLPDGVTVTEAIVYGYDGDAGNQFSFNLGRQLLTSPSYYVISTGSSGVAYAGGAINVTVTPTSNNVVNNSTYSYLLGITMPASGSVKLYNYRIQFTYSSPGSISQQNSGNVNGNSPESMINNSSSVDGSSR